MKFVSTPLGESHNKTLVTYMFQDVLFNIGKAEGSVDGGQMIKPALARGLQLVGATTRKFTLIRFRLSLIISV